MFEHVKWTDAICIRVCITVLNSSLGHSAYAFTPNFSHLTLSGCMLLLDVNNRLYLFLQVFQSLSFGLIFHLDFFVDEVKKRFQCLTKGYLVLSLMHFSIITWFRVQKMGYRFCRRPFWCIVIVTIFTVPQNS